MRRIGCAITIALGLCLSAMPAMAGTPRGAKALFYTEHGTSEMASQGDAPAPQAAAPQPKPPRAAAPQAASADQDKASGYMGVQYWIELTGRDGSKRRVTTDRTFRSGDRIKLFITTNRDGYLSLLNIGSSGRSRLLFPHAQMQPNENFVQANAQYEVPRGGAIRFDDTPGEETILLMLSPQPMQNIMPGGAQAYQAPPSAPSYQGPSDPAALPPPPPMSAGYDPQQTSQFITAANSKGAKDLVMETDTTSAQPASYAVAPMSSLGDSGMITLQLKLKHR